jgi:hypothetical protein
VFNLFIYAKQTSKFKIVDMGKQVDLLVDLYEISMIYNNLKDDILLKQSPFHAWDESHAFV